MSTAQTIIKNEEFLKDHRRIRRRLLRLRDHSGPDAGFPSVLSSLVACMVEIEGLLPELSSHFSQTQELVHDSAYSADVSNEAMQILEQTMSRHIPHLRELRALLDSGRRLIQELRAGRDAASMGEALRMYLHACALDLLDQVSREEVLIFSPEVSGSA